MLRDLGCPIIDADVIARQGKKKHLYYDYLLYLLILYFHRFFNFTRQWLKEREEGRWKYHFKSTIPSPIYHQLNTMSIIYHQDTPHIRTITKSFYHIAVTVVEPGKKAYKDIVAYFGKGILRANGTLNRDKLGSIVFSDAEKRRRLNAITHPQITKAMMKEIWYYLIRGKT